MSAPKIIVQIVVTGAQIFGKALYAAGKQAVKNAKARPQGGSLSDAAGVSNATSGSITDRLTRDHRMTLDEAHLVLNSKRGEPVDKILRNYEHLFKANSPPPPPEKPVTGKAKPQYYSHYLQSKVVRAKERIEAELKLAEEADTSATKPAESPPPPPPPPPQAGSGTST